MFKSALGSGVFVALLCGAGIILISSFGCASVGERAMRDPLTSQVGVYDPPPPGVQRVRVGVPPFSIERPRGRFDFSSAKLEGMAADQVTTLLFQTGRFDVIERAKLEQLLIEQDLEGIVRPGEMAQKAQVRGIDYMLLGKVTGFRMTAQRTSTEAGIGRGWVADQIGGVTGGYEQKEVVITTEMGVDIRLVDPSTGEVKTAHFSQFRQQETARSLGLEVAGVGARGDAEIVIGEDDAGRVMRMAFDDAIRKMLPDIDRRILTGASDSVQSAADTKSDSESAAAAFCSQCGTKLTDGARFCGGCGAQVE